jgi:hypothetical protein
LKDKNFTCFLLVKFYLRELRWCQKAEEDLIRGAAVCSYCQRVWGGGKEQVHSKSPHGLGYFSEGAQKDDITAQRAEREIDRKRR